MERIWEQGAVEAGDVSGRIRTIKPEVLDDEVAASLSDAAWRLWVSSWVLADDGGNLRAGSKFLAAQVWQDTSRDVEPALMELFKAGRFTPYSVGGQRYVHINNWERHQRVDNAGKPRVPPMSEDDGTWFQELTSRFAEIRREPPRVSASPSADLEVRRSRVARARIPAAGPRPRPPTPTETPTPEPAADDFVDGPPDSAFDTSGSPPGNVPGANADSGAAAAPTDPSRPKDVSLPPPESKTASAGRPGADTELDSPHRPMPASEAKAWGEMWLAEFRDLVTKTLGRPVSWDPFRARRDLDRVITNLCPPRHWQNPTDWLRFNVPEFVAAARSKPSVYSEFGPKGFEKWLNEQGPSEPEEAPPAYDPNYVAPPRPFDFTGAPETWPELDDGHEPPPANGAALLAECTSAVFKR